jgi:hypothetical protein
MTLPNFIILGVARCGTSSLFRTLKNFHPKIHGNKNGRELHFFDRKAMFNKGIKSYSNMFPDVEDGHITFEASPGYFENKGVAQRIKENLPGVKLIVNIRNPADRAWSHYHMIARSNRDKRSFWKAFNGSNGYSRLYCEWGKYVESFERWFKVFNKKKFFIVQSEDLWNRQQEVYDELFDFLGIESAPMVQQRYGRENEYSSMPKNIRIKLNRFYRSYNKKLYKLLDREMDW